MDKPDHLGVLGLAAVVALICIFAGATLRWKGRVALVLLTLATIFIWVAPEATGTAVVHARNRITRWLLKMK